MSAEQDTAMFDQPDGDTRPATRLSRNELLARLGDAERERDEWREEPKECAVLAGRMNVILTATANTLKGDAEPLELHSWHDLAEVAARLVAERDALAALIERAQTALAGHPRCDRHDEGDPITCGWKLAVADITETLTTAPTAALAAVKAEAVTSGWKAAAGFLSGLSVRTSQVNLELSATYDHAAMTLGYEITRAAAANRNTDTKGGE